MPLSQNVIGVTKHSGTPLSVVRFSASAEQTPYIETKPLHTSQMVVERNEETGEVIFQIEVVLNFEFYSQMLSYKYYLPSMPWITSERCWKMPTYNTNNAILSRLLCHNLMKIKKSWGFEIFTAKLCMHTQKGIIFAPRKIES